MRCVCVVNKWLWCVYDCRCVSLLILWCLCSSEFLWCVYALAMCVHDVCMCVVCGSIICVMCCQWVSMILYVCSSTFYDLCTLFLHDVLWFWYVLCSMSVYDVCMCSMSFYVWFNDLSMKENDLRMRNQWVSMMVCDCSRTVNILVCFRWVSMIWIWFVDEWLWLVYGISMRFYWCVWLFNECPWCWSALFSMSVYDLCMPLRWVSMVWVFSEFLCFWMISRAFFVDTIVYD